MLFEKLIALVEHFVVLHE